MWEKIEKWLRRFEIAILRIVVILIVAFLIMMGVDNYNWKPLTAACVILILFIYEMRFQR